MFNELEMKKAVRRWRYGRKATRDQLFTDIIYPQLKYVARYIVNTKHYAHYIPDMLDVIVDELTGHLVDALKQYREKHNVKLFLWLIICGKNYLRKKVNHNKFQKRDITKEVLVDSLEFDESVPFSLFVDEEEFVKYALEYWEEKGIDTYFKYGKQRKLATTIIDILNGTNKRVFINYPDLTGYLRRTAGCTRQNMNLAIQKFRDVNSRLKEQYQNIL